MAIWTVVGGEDKGGILVRSGEKTSSAALPDRLSTGAEIEEIEVKGERLHYKRLTGKGPDEGWVALKVSGKTIVELKAESASAAAVAVPSKKGLKRKPRVLCLHGTAGGKAIMETQLSKFFTKAKDSVDFVILQGPKECNLPEQVELMQKFFKGKPMMMYDELTFDDKYWRCYKDVRETLAWLQEQMKKEGDIDGVLGFSQGANFSVMLAAQSYAGAGMPLSFIIPMCPNAPGYKGQLPELFEEPLPVPALVVRGAQEKYDEGVQKKLEGKTIETYGEEIVSDHVVKTFVDAEAYSHPDGHRPMPAKPADQDALIAKIIDFIKAKAFTDPVVKKPAE